MEDTPVLETKNNQDIISRGGSKRSKHRKFFRHKKLVAIVAVIVVLAGIIGGVLYFKHNDTVASQINKDEYQALFLTNGQVYFGKLSQVGDSYYKLTTIFYLQTSSANAATSQNPQATSSSATDVKLIKLGDEVHGPEDEMVVGKEQVLFFENLKKDGKVAQSIAQYQTKK